MTPGQMRAAFDDVFDAPLIYHGFTPYFRDYQLIWDADNAPSLDAGKSGGRPFLRWLFVGCLRVETTLDPAPPEPGQPMFSDRYIRNEAGAIPALDDDETGEYAWVEFLNGYPGASLIVPSVEATSMSQKYSAAFHEALIEAPPQTIRIIFHDLRVEFREPGRIAGEIVHLDLGQG